MWISVVAWATAVVTAAVVLGFAGYEIWWKAGRLQGDLQRMLVLADTVQEIRSDLAAAQERLSRTGAH